MRNVEHAGAVFLEVLEGFTVDNCLIADNQGPQAVSVNYAGASVMRNCTIVGNETELAAHSSVAVFRAYNTITETSFTANLAGRLHSDYDGNGVANPDMRSYEYYWRVLAAAPLAFTNVVALNGTASNVPEV